MRRSTSVTDTGPGRVRELSGRHHDHREQDPGIARLINFTQHSTWSDALEPLGLNANYISVMREAENARRRLSAGHTVFCNLSAEADRRLFWTCLVDRHQVHPAHVRDLIDGQRPAKAYVRLLEDWVGR